MDVLNKLRSTVSSTVSSLSGVLPGNPVTREFEATTHICSAGPGLLWKVYSGFKNSTKQEASIFVFDKKLLERWPRESREAILESLKRGVTQLTKLRHPQILTVQHPLEESRDSLAFATEPVYASLANVLGNHDNLPPGPKDFKLFDVELKYGLHQIGEGLAFLHNDVKLVHNNICPESIVLNQQGAWKIFGFDYCIHQENNAGSSSWKGLEHSPYLPHVAQPNLDYLAPEAGLANTRSPACDMFSLGVVIHAMYYDGSTPIGFQSDFASYKRRIKELSNLPVIKLNKIPDGLREVAKMLLSFTAELRPDAHQFRKVIPFTGPIPQGMFPGRIIRVQGTVPPHSEKFAVNLLTGSGDIALHLSPNFHRGCIIRNSVIHMNWGHEEHHGGNPVHRNQYFDLVILCDPGQFKIAINGVHFTEFNHRVNYSTVTTLAIDGHVSVSTIAFEGAGTHGGFHAPTAPFQPSHHQPGIAPYPATGVPYLPPGGSHHVPYPSHPPHGAAYPVQPGYPPAPNYAGLSPHAAPGYPSHSPTAHKKSSILDKAGMAVAGALGASTLMGGHKYNKLGAVGGGGLGAALTGAALTGTLNPKKAMKKHAKAQKKALKYGLPIAGVGLGAYALHKGVHKMGHHHHHHRSSSSSSSSSSD